MANVANLALPGTACFGRDCRARFRFNPVLRDWYMVIAYPKCEFLLAAVQRCCGCLREHGCWLAALLLPRPSEGAWRPVQLPVRQ